MKTIPFPKSRFAAVNVSTVPQRSPLRYPGGKTWLVPHIREWLVTTRPKVLIEPFSGGGIVSLTAVMEKLVERAVMVEIDHDVAAFWHAALGDGARLSEKILADNIDNWVLACRLCNSVKGAHDVLRDGEVI